MKIKVKSSNDLYIHKFKVLIYKENKLIIDTYTNNGYINFSGQVGGYKIIINSNYLYPNNISTSFYNDGKDITFSFINLDVLPKYNYKIYLIDKNYSDFKINKGEVFLWLDHIK